MATRPRSAGMRHFAIIEHQLRHAVEQRARIGMAWRGVDLRRRSGLDDAAEVHDRDPVADMPDDTEVVTDEQHRQAEFTPAASGTG